MATPKHANGVWLLKATGKATCPICKTKVHGFSVYIGNSTTSRYHYHPGCLRVIADYADDHTDSISNDGVLKIPKVAR